ncbi:MAG: ABC transporter substrate-binding protein [Methylacidiphilales bacterium]|nr:ABC transporter substrate-binding protein [Candidatus Methylacidiphilales bacterium]MDW8349947.1 ABC transporter substrate-binding protein [Verrucomicrobiae bacterium]
MPMTSRHALAVLAWLSALFLGCRPMSIPPLQRPNYPPPEEYLKSPFATGKPGGHYIQVMMSEPNTFNPLISEDAASSAAMAPLQGTLLRYNPIIEDVEPGLAKAWTISPCQKRFTFHLRRGVRWSDGAPFTADDVVFTFQALYDPRYPNRKSTEFKINGEPFIIEKHDDYTLTIITPDIFAPFLLYVGAGLEILPKHKLEAAYQDGTLLKTWTVATAQEHPEELVSLGMFRLASYRPGERMIYEANPHFWMLDEEGTRLPYIDRMIVRFVKDATAAAVAFATGQTDSAGITPDNIEWIRKNEKVHQYTIYDRGPSTASSFIWFNQNPGTNAEGRPFVDPIKRRWFADQRFRQAISYGINRQGIVEGVLFGRGAPLWGPESPSNRKWYNPNVRQYPYDPARSRELLKEAGFTWNSAGELVDSAGHRVAFTLITNQENPIRQAMATVFKENMRHLGIDVRLQFMDFGSLVNKISETYDYEAGLLGFTGGGDPHGGMSIYHSSGRLHQWHPNQKSPATDWEKRIDWLMEAQLKTLDQAQRKAYYDEVQLIMSEQLPFIYLVTPNTYFGIKNRWANVQLPPSTGSPEWNLEAFYLTP